MVRTSYISLSGILKIHLYYQVYYRRGPRHASNTQGKLNVIVFVFVELDYKKTQKRKKKTR